MCAPYKNNLHHPCVMTPNLRCSPFIHLLAHPHYLFPHMEVPCAIHGKEDCLAVLLNYIPLQGISTTISMRRTTLRSRRQYSKEALLVLFRHTIVVTALQLRLCSRRSMMRKFLVCWLHHCTHRREKHVQTNQEFFTLIEIILGTIHYRSDRALGNLWQCFHRREKQAEIFNKTKEIFRSIKKTENCWRCKQIEHFRTLFPNSLKQNFFSRIRLERTK